MNTTTDTNATPATIPADAWTIDFNGTLVDIKTLPESSILAMTRRGLSHFKGNELASKVAGFKERHAKDNNGVAATDEQVAAYRAEASGKMLKALLEGTIGVRAEGTASPRVTDPVEKEARKIARAEIEANIAKMGLKAPKGAATITFADGTFTMEQLIARRIDVDGPLPQHAERIRKQAKKAVADVAKAVGEPSGNVDIATNSAADLGL